MATIKDAKYKVHNGTDFDTIHFETKASQVIANDGSNLESHLADYIPQWIKLTLQNGVQEYDEINGPRFCKLGNVVYIVGAVKNITQEKTIIATLPVGFRPKKQWVFAFPSSQESGITRFARWRVYPEGTIQMDATSDRKLAAGYWFPISMSFVIG